MADLAQTATNMAANVAAPELSFGTQLVNAVGSDIANTGSGVGQLAEFGAPSVQQIKHGGAVAAFYQHIFKSGVVGYTDSVNWLGIPTAVTPDELQYKDVKLPNGSVIAAEDVKQLAKVALQGYNTKASKQAVDKWSGALQGITNGLNLGKWGLIGGGILCFVAPPVGIATLAGTAAWEGYNAWFGYNQGNARAQALGAQYQAMGEELQIGNIKIDASSFSSYYEFYPSLLACEALDASNAADGGENKNKVMKQKIMDLLKFDKSKITDDLLKTTGVKIAISQLDALDSVTSVDEIENLFLVGVDDPAQRAKVSAAVRNLDHKQITTLLTYSKFKSFLGQYEDDGVAWDEKFRNAVDIDEKTGFVSLNYDRFYDDISQEHAKSVGFFKMLWNRFIEPIVIKVRTFISNANPFNGETRPTEQEQEATVQVVQQPESPQPEQKLSAGEIQQVAEAARVAVSPRAVSMVSGGEQATAATTEKGSGRLFNLPQGKDPQVALASGT